MTPNSCAFCQNRHSLGYLFQWTELRICEVCRSATLTYLSQLGIVMEGQHPLIRELCVDSHYIANSHWTYYNHVTKQMAHVARLVIEVDK